MIGLFTLLAVAAAALLLTRKPAPQPGGAPPSPPAPEPSPAAPPEPRFQLGQRVRAASGREGMIVAREFGKFQPGYWHYLLEGSSTWLREDVLELAPEPAPSEPTPPPPPAEEPTRPAKWQIGDPVVTTDGRTGPVSASRWDRHVQAWLYQVGNWSTWYQEASLSTPAPEPPSVPPSPAPVLPGTNQPAIRPGAVGFVLVLNEVAWRGSDVATQLDLAQRRFADHQPHNRDAILVRLNVHVLRNAVKDAEENLRRARAKAARYALDPDRRESWLEEVRRLEPIAQRRRQELAQAEAQADRLVKLLPLQFNTELAIIKSEVGVAVNTADAIARFGARTGGYQTSV